jgi:NTE family protein
VRAPVSVGFLCLLAREFPDVVPGILTGVSAGGISAAYLAARQESFAAKVERLAEIWEGLRLEHVFRVDVGDLASRIVRWGGRLVSGGGHPLPLARSMVDTTPLGESLEKVLETNSAEITGISRSLEAGRLRTFALTASSYTTGQSMTWVQTRPDCGTHTWDRPQRKSATCTFRVDHVMASAALSFLFPAVNVE